MNNERVGSLFFLLVGAFAFLYALDYELGPMNQPGPAMFPLILSASLFIVGILILISGKGEKRVDGRASLKELVRPMKIVLLTVGFIIVFGRLGYLITSFLYLFGLFLWVCRFRPWKAVVWSILLAPASFYFFGKLLGILFPVGPLSL